jgi:hypothetical protein
MQNFTTLGYDNANDGLAWTEVEVEVGINANPDAGVAVEIVELRLAYMKTSSVSFQKQNHG